MNETNAATVELRFRPRLQSTTIRPKCLNGLKPQSHIHDFGPGRATVHSDLASKIGVNRDELEWQKRKSSINTVFHDAPTVSARFVYGSTTTRAGSNTIHPDGATNAQECPRCGHDSIRCYYGSSR